MTDGEELALIDAALRKAYEANAQAYSIADRAKTLLDIKDLTARKKELQTAIARQSSGGFAAAQFIDVP